MSGLSVRLPANSPAWLLALALVAIIVLAALLAAVRIARHVMPQDSADRLTWWRDRRTIRAVRRLQTENAELRRSLDANSGNSTLPPEEPIAARTGRKTNCPADHSARKGPRTANQRPKAAQRVQAEADDPTG